MSTSPPSARSRLRLVFAAVALLGVGAVGAARADEAADHYNLGLQLKRVGKVDEAIAEVEKAIVARPKYAAAHLTLGNLWRAKGDYAKAADEYEKTVGLESKDPI